MSNSQHQTPLLILVDGHSLAFRSYYAYAKSRDGGLRTSTGIPTSVTFGFLQSLLEVLKTEQPTHVAIAFDLATPTFRHEADETYKAGRAETPEDFIPDLANLQEILEAFNLSVVTAPGYEADDILGTLATQASAANYRVKILSGDRDLFQLVNTEPGEPQGISMIYLSNAFSRNASPGGTEFGISQVIQKLKVTPEQVVDYKALCGDASDNIPGVRGIGAKTAEKLLKDYQTLDGIYAALDTIKGATRKKLEDGKDAAEHSQFMAQIECHVPLDISIDDCHLKGFQDTKIVPLLQKLEFRSFLNQLPTLQPIFGGQKIDEQEAIATTSSTTVDSQSNAKSGQIAKNDDTWFFSAEDTEASTFAQPAQIQPQIIDTAEKLADLVGCLSTCTDAERPVAWDTETTALEPRDAELVGIGCCWGLGSADLAYIPLGHKQGEMLSLSEVLEALRPILEDKTYPKVLQNAKFDRLVLRSQGIQLRGVVFDTMLASYVINPDDSHNLADLGLRHLNIVAQSYKDLVPKGKTIADLEIASVAQYCGTDVYSTFHLVPILQEKLTEISDLDTLLKTVELPLEPVLAEMEYQGIRIDLGYLQRFSKNLDKDLTRIEQQAYQSAGTEFNLGSPKQLSEILFEQLGLDKKKSRKIKTGYSTDAATLEKLQGDHPVIDAILEYRTLAKLKSTYVDALPTLVRSDTQRVHTDFNQAITTTGRLSSSNPNLQNIPIRTAFSRQIRAAFIPEPDWILVAADYSQIELRILAHLSEEPVLIQAYRNNEDVHTLTAKLLFEKDEIAPEERRLGKVINFGVIYGMGAGRFAREAGVSRNEAKEFIERFNDRYPLVFEYLQRMQQEAIAHGYVTTLLGRRRYFNFTSNSLKRLQGRDPDSIDLSKIKSPGAYDAQLMRAAANAPIQGSSADIIKIAMVKLQEVLAKYQARMLLQVHDELVFEMPPEEWEELQPKIQTTMEEAIALRVPLKVEAKAGQNWMETK